MKKEAFVVVGVVVVAVLFFTYAPQREEYVFPKDYLLFVHESNGVVIRMLYNTEDTQEVFAPAQYAIIVFTAKGKHVIIQSVEGNVCYSNEGNAEQVVTKTLIECELEGADIPVIVFQGEEEKVDVKGNKMVISGRGEELYGLGKQFVRSVYSDAEYVYRKALSTLPASR